jgi:four helix bundle protein
MAKPEMQDFNNNLKERAKLFAILICRTLKNIPYHPVTKEIVSQLVRSSGSVSANFSSATRARSLNEYYAKLCIVVEECDETVHWLDIMISAELLSEEVLKTLRNEAFELLCIFSSVRRRIRTKLHR